MIYPQNLSKRHFQEKFRDKNMFCQIVGIYRCFRGSFGDKIFDT